MQKSTKSNEVVRYEHIARLGVGGMAEVLLARLRGPRGFERPVVLKRILPRFATDPSFLDMLVDEARIVGMIHHRNVVRVHELTEIDGELFIVMEYLEGESLASIRHRLHKRGRTLDFGLAAHVLSEVCAGLHAAHELTDSHGVPQMLVHRDVTPANVFVTYDGDVKLLDFGIAKAVDRVTRTRNGMVKGKYAYLSPEQCMGRPLDRRSDIFSLGVALWEVTTGRRLFRREGDIETLRAILDHDVPAPSRAVENYPPELEAICLRALASDPDDRYPTALEMRRDLQAVARSTQLTCDPSEALQTLTHELFEENIRAKRALLGDLGSAPKNPPRNPTIATEHDFHLDIAVELEAVEDSDSIEGSLVDRVDSILESLDRELEVEVDEPRGKRPATVVASELSDRPAILVQERTRSLVDVSIIEMPSSPVFLRTKGPRWARRAAIFAMLTLPFIVGIELGAKTAPAQSHTQADASHAAAAPSTPVRETTPRPSKPSTVKLRIVTTPPNARAFVDGEPVGNSPLELDLDRSDEPVSLRLELDGREHVEEIVPDVDQRIAVSLAAEAPPPAAQPKKPRPPKVLSKPKRSEPAGGGDAPGPETSPYERFD